MAGLWAHVGSSADTATEIDALRAEIATLSEDNLRLRLMVSGVRETDRVALRLADSYAIGDATAGAFAETLAVRDHLVDICRDLGGVLEQFVARLESSPFDSATTDQVMTQRTSHEARSTGYS